MLCLYIVYPQFAVPVLAWAVKNDQLAVSTRLEAVATLVKGAYSLSGLPEPGAGSKKSNSVAEKLELAVVVDEKDGKKIGKTTINRPRKLAAMQREKRYVKNHFGLIAEAVYHPIASIVSALLADDAKVPSALPTAVDLTDVIRHKRGGINEVLTSIDAPKLRKRLSEVVDGIDMLLPSQCMLALASFTKCSVNSLCQR